MRSGVPDLIQINADVSPKSVDTPTPIADAAAYCNLQIVHSVTSGSMSLDLGSGLGKCGAGLCQLPDDQSSSQWWKFEKADVKGR